MAREPEWMLWHLKECQDNVIWQMWQRYAIPEQAAEAFAAMSDAEFADYVAVLERHDGPLRPLERLDALPD